MKILLTNDDGIAADGLAALAKACTQLGHRVTVVAPAVEQSMCGHRVTIHTPIEVEQRAADRFAVGGTPADCVRVALFSLGLKPDAILSGINHGGNMGQDIHISGTCAAAREAAYHQHRAFAVSHYLRRDLALDWEKVIGWLKEVLPPLLTEPHTEGTWTNVNVPHLPEGETICPPVLVTQPEMAPIGVSYEARPAAGNGAVSALHYNATYGDRPQTPGSDVHTTFGGGISVSRIRV